jgi:hypothetical protein
MNGGSFKKLGMGGAATSGQAATPNNAEGEMHGRPREIGLICAMLGGNLNFCLERS